MLKTNTIIISAFGREHNLVSQLKSKNIDVTVFNVTDALSAEGLPVLSPFGWFGEDASKEDSGKQNSFFLCIILHKGCIFKSNVRQCIKNNSQPYPSVCKHLFFICLNILSYRFKA